MTKFSIKLTEHENNSLLNICDSNLLGKTIKERSRKMDIGKYYEQKIVNEQEASKLLLESNLINIVGEDAVDLSLKLEIGLKSAVKRINSVPFLLIFKT